MWKTTATIAIAFALIAPAGAQTAGGMAATAPGKAVVAQTVKATATITALDKTTRDITLKGPQGNLMTVTAGPEVKNFDKLKVGDTGRHAVRRGADARTEEGWRPGRRSHRHCGRRGREAWRERRPEPSAVRSPSSPTSSPRTPRSRRSRSRGRSIRSTCAYPTRNSSSASPRATRSKPSSPRHLRWQSSPRSKAALLDPRGSRATAMLKSELAVLGSTMPGLRACGVAKGRPS